MIASDIHGSALYCRQMLEAYRRDVYKRQNQNPVQKMMGALGEIFAPLIPALICGGLVLGFRNVIDSIDLFENGTKTLVEISQFWACLLYTSNG